MNINVRTKIQKYNFTVVKLIDILIIKCTKNVHKKKKVFLKNAENKTLVFISAQEQWVVFRFCSSVQQIRFQGGFLHQGKNPAIIYPKPKVLALSFIDSTRTLHLHFTLAAPNTNSVPDISSRLLTCFICLEVMRDGPHLDN